MSGTLLIATRHKEKAPNFRSSTERALTDKRDP